MNKINAYISLIVLCILLATFFSYANAQTPTKIDSCDFFNKVKFRNGRDTLLILAKYYACTKIHHSGQLKTVAAKKLVNLSEFTYMVGFTPIGCEEEQAAECSDTSAILYTINPVTYTKPVLYRCIFFEGIFRDKEKKIPYFIVDKTILQD